MTRPANSLSLKHTHTQTHLHSISLSLSNVCRLAHDFAIEREERESVCVRPREREEESRERGAFSPIEYIIVLVSAKSALAPSSEGEERKGERRERERGERAEVRVFLSSRLSCVFSSGVSKVFFSSETTADQLLSQLRKLFLHSSSCLLLPQRNT
jgi:hypothetical protein